MFPISSIFQFSSSKSPQLLILCTQYNTYHIMPWTDPPVCPGHTSGGPQQQQQSNTMTKMCDYFDHGLHVLHAIKQQNSYQMLGGGGRQKVIKNEGLWSNLCQLMWKHLGTTDIFSRCYLGIAIEQHKCIIIFDIRLIFTKRVSHFVILLTYYHCKSKCCHSQSYYFKRLMICRFKRCSGFLH